MSEAGADISAPGRPSAGQALAQNLSEAAAKRGRSRNIGALRRLAPFARAHWGDASLAGLFLILSTCATLGISGAIRLLVDHLTDKGLDPSTVDQKFLILGAVAVGLAISTAGRFFFVTKVGERIVADLRKATYAHILTLDPSYFLKTRTGEVLSRLTTDIAIVESLVATSVSVAARNFLM
ncbi:MAG: ABC transporter transmembrane domain-containing protein, partial [Alphaproteobacteria bacterium]